MPVNSNQYGRETVHVFVAIQHSVSHLYNSCVLNCSFKRRYAFINDCMNIWNVFCWHHAVSYCVVLRFIRENVVFEVIFSNKNTFCSHFVWSRLAYCTVCAVQCTCTYNVYMLHFSLRRNGNWTSNQPKQWKFRDIVCDSAIEIINVRLCELNYVILHFNLKDI